MADDINTVALVFKVEGSEKSVADIKRVGATGLAAADDIKKATERVAGESLKQARSFDTLARRIDPLGQAVRDATRDMERLAAASAGTGQSAVRAAELMGAAQARVTAAQKAQAASTMEVTRQTGAASSMMRQFGIQSFDVFSQLQAGAPIMTTFVQQGSQIAQMAAAQGGALAALGQVAKSALGALLSPIGLAVTATAALAVGMYALGSASEGSARRLNDIQNALRTTRDDYASLADQVDATAKKIAATTGIGSSDALAAGKILAASPSLTGGADQIERLTKLSNDLAISLGITLPEAAAKTAAAMADPAAALQKLADDRFRTVNQETATYAKRLQDAGNAAGAFAVWQAKVGAATAGASEALTPLGKSLRDLSKSFTDVGQDGRSFADSLGSGITAVAAQFVNRITQIIDAAKWAKGQAERLVSAVRDAPPLPSAGMNQVLASRDNAHFGVMQVSQDLGRSFNQDINTLQGNIATGVQYISTLAQLQNSTLESIIGGYNRGPAGYRKDPASARAYIDKVLSANADQLPADVDALIDQQATLAQLSDRLRVIAKQIAVVESGGRQFAGPASASTAQVSAQIPLPPLAVQVGSGDFSRPGQVSQLVNEALKYAATLDTITAKRDFLASKADQFGRALAVPDQSATSYASLNEGLATIRGQLESLRTPQETFIKGLADAAATAGLEGGAAKALADAYKGLNDAARAATGAGATQAQLDAARTAIMGGLNKELQLNLTQTVRQIQANRDLLPFIERGGVALEERAAAVKAETDALAFGARGTAEYDRAVRELTAANITAAASERDKIAAADINAIRQQIEYTERELGLINATNEKRARELAILKERQKLGIKVGQEATAEQQRALDAAGQLADMQATLLDRQNSFRDVTNSLATAFDRVAQGAVDAALAGGNALKNLANVGRAVAASLITDFAKFAIANPLRNAIFGGQASTLGSAFAAISPGGGMLGNLSNASSLAGLSDALGITSIKDTLMGWGNSLGITGNGGLIGGLNSLLSTTIFHGPAGSLAASAGAEFGIGAAASAGSPISLGSLLGGIGAGFGIGSFGGGLLQGSLGKTGPAPTIGAGVGSVGGALIGSIVPGIGTVLGAIIGGALGGGAGGLIGPQKASSFSSTGLGISATGGLDIGQTVSQIADTTAELAQLQAQVAQINQLLAASGAVITSLGGVSQIGQNTPGGFQDPSKAAGLDAAFSGLRFSAPGDDILNRQISGRSFASAQELAAATQEVKNFVDVVVPALKRLGEPDKFGIGTLSAGLEEIKAQFVGAIATAQKLGYAENDLVAARERALTVAQSNALQSLKDIDVGLSQRQMNATAIITGKPEDAMAAALAAFDAAADAQRKQLNDSLLSLLGDAGKTHILYTDRMVLLEKTLGEERLAVSKQYNDAITAAAANQNAAAGTASGVIRSITNYARGLQFGSESPLSATSQLNAATMQFDAVRGAAAAGDFNSAQQLTGFAETLRTAARNVFGSGVGYVDVIKKITDALEPISTMAPERLITSVMTTEIRSQTQTLSADLMDLKTAINQVRDSIRAGSGAPPASRAA